MAGTQLLLYKQQKLVLSRGRGQVAILWKIKKKKRKLRILFIQSGKTDVMPLMNEKCCFTQFLGASWGRANLQYILGNSGPAVQSVP